MSVSSVTVYTGPSNEPLPTTQSNILELSVRRRHLEPAPGRSTSRIGREDLVQRFAEGSELRLSELYGYLLRVGGVEFDVCVGDRDRRS